MPAIARVIPDPGRRFLGSLRSEPRSLLPPLAAVATWALAAAVAAMLGYDAIMRSPHMVDLGVYRAAGRNVLAGNPVYAPVTAAELPHLGRSLLVFTYPPISAVLSVPLALLGTLASRVIWTIAAVYAPLAAVIVITFRPLIARARRYGPAVAGLIFVAAAVTLPMRDEIAYGQVDILLAALCVADIGARRPSWPSGLLIGLATAVKLTPAVFIVYLLITGRRKAAITAAASAAAFTALPWAIIPSGASYYWTKAIFDPNRLGRNAQISNQSVRGMLLRWFWPSAPPGWVWPLLAVLIAVAGFALARRAFRRGNDLAGVAMVGLLAILISPVSWIHHLVWIVAAIGAITGDARVRKRAAAAAAAGAFFVVTSPYQGQVAPGRLGGDLIQLLWQDSYGIAAVIMFVILAMLPCCRPAPARPRPLPSRPPRELDDPAAVFRPGPARARRETSAPGISR